MAHWAAVNNGGPRNCSLRPLSRPDVFDPASYRRNRACLIVALFAALLLLYCPSPVRSGVRKRTHVCGLTSSGISLECVASDNPSRRRFRFVRLCSRLGHWCSDAHPHGDRSWRKIAFTLTTSDTSGEDFYPLSSEWGTLM